MRDLPSEPPSSEITPEHLYLSRREFIKNGALMLGTAMAVGSGLSWLVGQGPPPEQPEPPSLVDTSVTTNSYTFDEAVTPYQDVTTYNNYYEFGVGKGDPARRAHILQTRPWTVSIEGEVAKPQVI